MARRRRAVVPASLAAFTLLAACSGEPSEKEMRTQVERHTRQTLEMQGNRGFTGFDVFRKQGCVEDKSGKDGAYDCYYAATFAPQAGRPALTVNGKGRFTRTDRGLSFEDLGAQPR